MRLRLVTLFAVVVVGVTWTSLGLVPPPPGCENVGACIDKILPATTGPNPDAIKTLAMVDLPGLLVISNVKVDSTPQTAVFTLPATITTYNASTNTPAGFQSGVLTAGYQTGTPTGQQYPCVYNRNNKYFVAHKPVTTNGSNNVYQYRWQFSPYSQRYARKIDGRWTWQAEICATGGADGQNGYRTLYNASIMAVASNNGNQRIGLANDTGSDGSASASLTMSASLGPVTIGANVPTYSGGSLYGQYGKPRYKSPVDKYYQTESFAGWTASCTYARWCGSPNMQSQVHHGLFEFYHGDWNKSFPLDAQWNFYCANPYGMGCG